MLLVGVFTLATLGVPRLHVYAMPDAATLELAAFALPDGSLPQLCLAYDAAEGGGGLAPPHCFACRLVLAAGVLPASAGFDHPQGRPVGMPVQVAETPVCPDPVWQAGSARAPPADRAWV
jgi:hypothetical protein